MLGCIILLTLRMLMAALVAEAQQQSTVHRIGWLGTDFPAPAATFQAREEAFRQGLSTLGYVEGQNVVLEFCYAAGNSERLPTMYSWRVFVDAGGLISYGPNFRDTDRCAATCVHKILQGVKPADLPVEQPT